MVGTRCAGLSRGGGMDVLHRRGGGGARRCVLDCVWCSRFVSWQVPRPEIGLAGLQKPLVRQVSNVAVTKCSLCAEGHAFPSTLSLLDSDLTNCCWEKGTLPTLVHELLVLARQAHNLAASPVSLVQCARRQTF